MPQFSPWSLLSRLSSPPASEAAAAEEAVLPLLAFALATASPDPSSWTEVPAALRELDFLEDEDIDHKTDERIVSSSENSYLFAFRL